MSSPLCRTQTFKAQVKERQQEEEDRATPNATTAPKRVQPPGANAGRKRSRPPARSGQLQKSAILPLPTYRGVDAAGASGRRRGAMVEEGGRGEGGGEALHGGADEWRQRGDLDGEEVARQQGQTRTESGLGDDGQPPGWRDGGQAFWSQILKRENELRLSQEIQV